MKTIKIRMMVKSIKRINKQARVLTRAVAVRKHTARSKDNESTSSSSERIQGRIHAAAHRTVRTVIRVPITRLVTINRRWRSHLRFHHGDPAIRADTQQQTMIRVRLRRMPSNGKGPRLAKRKRTLPQVEETARHVRRRQPADKKKGIGPNPPRPKRSYDEKSKVYAPRQKHMVGTAPSFSGTLKRNRNIRQKRFSLKGVAPSIKVSRSVGQGTSQREKRSTQQQGMIQAAIQARHSIQWSRAAAQMNLRMVKLLIRAIALLVKGLSAMLGISSSIIILLCIIMIVAALLSSPFGIFVADENTEPDTKKMVQIVDEIDAVFSARIASMQQAAGKVDRVEIQFVGSADNSRIDNWTDVVAVYAVKTSTDRAAGMDVVTMDHQREELLQAVFWDMNRIDSHIETLEHTRTVAVEQSDGSVEEQSVTEEERVLQLSISARTAEQQAALYDFSTEQADLMKELLSAEFRPMMMDILGKNGDTGLTTEQVAAMITDLPTGMLGSQAVELALTRLGDPYSQLKAGQDRYTDCSYLVQWVYRQLGVELPRTAAEQARFIVENGLSLTSDELMAGDLIFWSYEPNGRFMDITHVGIYAGEGKVIDASSSRLQVVYRNVFDADLQVMYGRPYAQI
ncbi:C40 family peptidase [Cohnella sp. GCM10012308]|uniref:C40 family peptidase n=1 Tax=Cohnella sp. GCM10012308 TaxID=3317329 RepID=UPI00361966C5